MKSYSKPYLFELTILLKGNYPTSEFKTNSPQSIDSIWSSLRDLFVSHGVPVKTIDKKQRLLVSTKTSFTPVFTFEDKDGQLQEREAWVVLRKFIVNKKEWNPKEI